MQPGQGQSAFNSATLLLANTCRSLVRNATKRQQLLYLLTCHVCFLRYGKNDGTVKGTVEAPGIVGRINQASEGSVSVSAEYANNVPLTAAYFQQTPWGAEYWAATAKYRTFHYAPPPQSCCTACGGPLGACGCFAGIGPVGTGFPGYNGGSA